MEELSEVPEGRHRPKKCRPLTQPVRLIEILVGYYSRCVYALAGSGDASYDLPFHFHQIQDNQELPAPWLLLPAP